MNWWLRRIKFILSHVWRKTEIKVLVRLVVLEALRENLIHASLLASLLAVLCVPWQSLSLSPLSQGVLCMYVFVCLCAKLPLLIRMSVSGLTPVLVQYDLILTSLHLQRSYFQKRLHSEVPSGHELGGGTIQPSIV